MFPNTHAKTRAIDGHLCRKHWDEVETAKGGQHVRRRRHIRWLLGTSGQLPADAANPIRCSRFGDAGHGWGGPGSDEGDRNL